MQVVPDPFPLAFWAKGLAREASLYLFREAASPLKVRGAAMLKKMASAFAQTSILGGALPFLHGLLEPKFQSNPQTVRKRPWTDWSSRRSPCSEVT